MNDPSVQPPSIPRLALFDDPLDLRVTGLSPGRHAVVRACAHSSFGDRWSSWAEFTVPADGTLDPACLAPEGGSYEGVDDHGLLWSLSPENGKDPQVVPAWLQLEITVESDGFHETFETTRAVRLPGVEAEELDSPPVQGMFYAPRGRLNLPTVVLVGGTSEPPGYLAACLAGHGFGALSLRLFGRGREGLPRRFVNIPVESISRAMDWVAARPEVASDGVGLLAVSAGAPGVLMAAHDSVCVRAVAILSGATIMLPTRGIAGRSPWTRDGKVLPALKSRAGGLAFLRGSAEGTQAALITSMLQQENNLASVDMHLENLDLPVLVAAGDQDELIPMEATLKGLEKRGARTDDVILRYRGAGHIHRPPGMPSTPSRYRRGGFVVRSSGGTAAANAFAIRDSWTNVVRFFRQHLGDTDEVPRSWGDQPT